MVKKISIIIPVYNVGKYLEKCILSIVSQNTGTDSYELIAVNDGSTDNSREILDKLQKQYPFIIIIDKENGGLSSARNEGIIHATGEYIFFIDADDWLSENSLDFLSEWIKSQPADIYLFGICEIYDDGKMNLLYNSLSHDNEVMDIPEYLNDYTLRSAAWQGLFRRELFIHNNIRFKHGFLAEDDDFVVRYFSTANTVVCNRRVTYFYYQRPGSISKGKEFEEKIINDKLIMLGEMDTYVQSFGGKRKEGLQRKLDFLAVDIIRLLMRKNHSDEIIDRSLERLKEEGYFPLKKASYSGKYRLFRFLFDTPSKVKSGRTFRKYI